MALKLVVSNPEARRELHIVAQIHRASQQSADRGRRLTRYYSGIDHAIPKLTAFMVAYGYVGDVCEVSHRITGLQIGTLKLTARGRLITEWIWEREE